MPRMTVPLLLVAVACDQPKTPPIPVPPPLGSPAAVAPAGEIEGAAFADSLHVDLKASTKNASGLYSRDLTVGTGPEVTKGQQVSVHYAGWLPNGTSFDKSGPTDPALTFTVGAGRVIPGWDEGLVGMRVGGKRQLIIPPALGYGASGNGPIPPNAVLVFTVDLVSVK